MHSHFQTMNVSKSSVVWSRGDYYLYISCQTPKMEQFCESFLELRFIYSLHFRTNTKTRTLWRNLISCSNVFLSEWIQVTFSLSRSAYSSDSSLNKTKPVTGIDPFEYSAIIIKNTLNWSSHISTHPKTIRGFPGPTGNSVGTPSEANQNLSFCLPTFFPCPYLLHSYNGKDQQKTISH